MRPSKKTVFLTGVFVVPEPWPFKFRFEFGGFIFMRWNQTAPLLIRSSDT